MSDLLLLEERIKNTIQLGESHFREFKSALEGREENKKPRLVKKICEDIGEALVSFANADGGELLIGVEDNGIISGVPHNETEIEQMVKAPTTHVYVDSKLPITSATKVVFEGKTIIFFSVTKGTSEIYQLPDGRCVRRRDKETIPISVRHIINDRQELKSREFDREFVDGATVADLDVPFVQEIANKYLIGQSVERHLQYLGLAEYAVGGLKLRRAALLLFANKIKRWHPRSQVRFIEVIGTEIKSGESYNVRKDESVDGNIFELLQKSWEKLRSYLAYKTEFGADAKFEQKYVYPEFACYEALVNAIAHRDYSVQNGVDIFIYDDRMEIKSPGSLLSTLTINALRELKGEHESRNVLICKALRENNYMRELGEGMKRIFALMEDNELAPPRLETTSTSFSVTLSHRSVFTTRQEEWLSLFSQFNPTPLQKKIIVAGIDDRELSPYDIYKAMNTNNRDTYDKEVTVLRVNKILLEIRSNSSAIIVARQRNINKQHVPRYRVQIPMIEEMADSTSVKTISIIQKQRDPNLWVFVGGLSWDVSKEDIKSAFESCGKIKQIEMPTGIGYCFIGFEQVESVRTAIRNFNRTVLGQKVIEVKPYKPR